MNATPCVPNRRLNLPATAQLEASANRCPAATRSLPEEPHLWTMDEKPPAIDDPNRNTHLWIVMQAAKLAKSDPLVGADLDRWFFGGDPEAVNFQQGLNQGIWDADHLDEMTGPLVVNLLHTAYGDGLWNDPTLAPLARTSLLASYIRHFYNPETQSTYVRGWPNALDTSRSAYGESVRVWKTIGFYHPGYYLGLALHFFGDVTQPLHAHNYPAMLNFLTHHDIPNPTHSWYEEWANTLLPSLGRSANPPGEMRSQPESQDNPDELFLQAASFAKQYCEEIHGTMIRHPIDWRKMLETTTKYLLERAPYLMAPYLIGWMREIKASTPAPTVKFAGPLACYASTSTPFLNLVAVSILGIGRFAIHSGDSGDDMTTEQQTPLLFSTFPGTLAAIESPVPDGSLPHPMRIFRISSDGRLLTTAYTGEPSHDFKLWTDLGTIQARDDGAPLTVSSLVTLRRETSVDIFVISSTGELLHSCWSSNTLSPWEPLGTSDIPSGGPLSALMLPYLEESATQDPVLSGSPLAVNGTPLEMHVFAVSGTGHLLLRSYYSKTHWTLWSDLNATSSGGGYRVCPGCLTAIINRHGNSEIFAIANDGSLIAQRWEGRWLEENLGRCEIEGGLGNALVALTGGPNEIDILALSKHGTIVYKYYRDGSWHGWVRY